MPPKESSDNQTSEAATTEEEGPSTANYVAPDVYELAADFERRTAESARQHVQETTWCSIRRWPNYISRGYQWLFGQLTFKDIPCDIASLHESDSQQGIFNNTGDILDFHYDQTTYFNDGFRKIDFVLVYTDNDNQDMREKHRSNFISMLPRMGLKVETDSRVFGDTRWFFVKVHCPSHVMNKWAERFDMPALVNITKVVPREVLNKKLEKFKIFRAWRPNLPLFMPHTELAQFRVDKKERYHSLDAPGSYFLSSQRIFIVNEILSAVVYGDRRKAEIGLQRLVNNKTFTLAYPLHDGGYHINHTNINLMNMRQLLNIKWASYQKLFCYQPIELIKHYFGEKVAFYFCCQGFYTFHLLILSLFGLGVFICGAFETASDVVLEEICHSNISMCVNCEFNKTHQLTHCTTMKLREDCPYEIVARLFDNNATIMFAVIVSLWARLFIIAWSRKQAELAHRWKTFNLLTDDRPRPAFFAKAYFFSINPITGHAEPIVSESARLIRMLASKVFIILMICCTLGSLILIIKYQLHFTSLYGEHKNQVSKIAVDISTSIFNLTIIYILQRVYRVIAYVLNEWEMHRTQAEFEMQLTLKLFVFNAINYLAHPFYIAFLKGKFDTSPGEHVHVFGLKIDSCRAGCFYEIATMYGFTIIGRQILNIMGEHLHSLYHRIYQKYHYITHMNLYAYRWIQELALQDCENYLYDEYSELVLQFGIITIFVVGFPLAPIIAVFSNWIGLRIIAIRFLKNYKRVVAVRSQDIGIWMGILSAISYVAILSNGCLIAFTSDFLPRMYYKYRKNYNLVGFSRFNLSYYKQGDCYYVSMRDPDGNYRQDYWELMAIKCGFLLIFEHVIISVVKVIIFYIPDLPKSVTWDLKKRNHLIETLIYDV